MSIEIDFFNGLIWINNLNEIFSYDYSKEIASNISKNNEIEEGKEIEFIDNISYNKIILLFKNNSCDLIELNAETESLTINCEEIFNDINNSNNIDAISSLLINNSLNPKESSKMYWKIYEFEMKEDNIEIKKSYKFKSEFYYLGKMNNQTIFLFNKTLRKIILFDLVEYSSVLEISFKCTPNPLSIFYLNTRKDFLDLLLIKEEGYISQCTLNMKLASIHEIEKTQIVENDNKMQNGSKNENKFKTNIVKTINLTNNSFLIFNKGNDLYKLKKSY